MEGEGNQQSIHMEKEASNVLLFISNKIIYLENPGWPNKELLV